MTTSLDGNHTSSSVAFSVLCATSWPEEYHSTIVEFVHTKSQGLPLENIATGLRLLAENNRPIALALIDDIRSRLSIDATQVNLDLIIALGELRDQAPETTQQLERIVGIDHAVLSPQAAAALLMINRFNSVANAYLTDHLHAEDPEQIWRAAYGLWISDCVTTKTLALLKQHLAHTDARVRTLCASAILKGEADQSDTDVANSTLAGVLCIPDRATPTGFVYPSSPGASHRIFALRAIENSEDVVSVYWGPLLGILIAEDSSASQTTSILRLKAVKLISRQESLPSYVVKTLSIMARMPELFGMQPLDETSINLVNEIELKNSIRE